MNTSRNIRLAEEELLDTAMQRLSIVFRNTSLTGHNTDHHLRVWKNAARITEALSQTGYDLTLQEIRELMLASLFHDAGMIYETGENHGMAGAELFLSFNEFKNRGINLQRVARAIENHDDKSYLNGTGPRQSILTILSTADDMDAFGIIGFLRYLEIYSHREVSTHLLSKDIIKNASSRLNNFIKTWSDLEKILSQTKRRFNTLARCCRAIEDPELSHTIQLFADRSFFLARQENYDLFTAATTLLEAEFNEVMEIAGNRDDSISDML
jgi:HD superfamily phosphodiesterase